MKNIEYSKMAYVYDKFYINKNYKQEVDFITSFIKDKKCKILDAGCGTGNHAKILYDLGYNVFGFDKSQNMVDIANSKISGNFFQADLLKVNLKEKYDMIISFFAVFNHLKNYREFKKALTNLKKLLKKDGVIVIDLHNPQRSGEKMESFDNIFRIMQWKKCSILNKEFSKITYIIDGKVYKTKHVFKIFKIKRLEKLVKRLGFINVNLYENYDKSKIASQTSKNIQLVLTNNS